MKIRPGRYYWTHRGTKQRHLAVVLSVVEGNPREAPYWPLVRLFSPRRRRWLKVQTLPPELFAKEASAKEYAVRYALTCLSRETISRAHMGAPKKKGRNGR